MTGTLLLAELRAGLGGVDLTDPARRHVYRRVPPGDDVDDDEGHLRL